MSVISNNQLAGAAGQGGSGQGGSGYTIERSLRFNSADSAYLNRTPASAGNRKTWTWSGWVKRSKPGSIDHIFNADGYSLFYFFSDDNLDFDGGGNGALSTAWFFRDFSAWYHIVLAFDTTQATASDRIKLWVNGEQVQNWGGSPTLTYPTQNADGAINSTGVHKIGHWNTEYSNFYLADIHFIDGQALAPTDFGEFDTNNIWQPKAYTGTYGTNGFHLDFSDNSSNAALGTDSSGNSNDWTVNNISNTVAVNKTYALAGYTATNGVAPNGGTPYWVDIVPSNANLNYWSGSGLQYGFYEVHDNSLSEYLYWTGSSYSTGNVTQARFDLRDYSTVSSVRIYARHVSASASYPAYVARLLDSNKNVINNTSISITNTTVQWLTIPVSGSPAFVEIYAPTPANARVHFHAIEVNGTQLTNTVATAANSDSLLDSPTNGTQTDTGVGGEVVGNYCTLNPIFPAGSVGYDNGNLDANGNAQNGQSIGTIAPSSGKWYYEVTLTGLSSTDPLFGISKVDDLSGSYPGAASTSYAVYNYTSNTYISKVNNGSYTNTNTTVAVQGDVIGVAFDLDNGKFWISKNNTWVDSGNPAAGTNALFSSLSGSFVPAIRVGGSNTGSCTLSCNFGQRPFAYTAPTGFLSLCTSNLPTPTIADGSTAFDVALYTGNGSGQTISGLNFSPDLVWLKIRSGSYYHNLLDTIRGGNARLSTNTSDAENTGSAGGATPLISSFNADGFTLPNGNINVNQNNSPYVAWNWDAGTSTVSNTDGNITSSVRANPSAGFSIVTWTGTANATVGHGLNAAPQLVITKSRSLLRQWRIWSAEFPNLTADYVSFSTASPVTYSGTYWGSMTSTTIGLGAGTYENNIGDMIAYCFTPVEGYSAMGSYTGNGSNDGTFVFTGMRIKWLMIKEISTGSTAIDPGHWMIVDTERDTYNIVNRRLHAELQNSEYTNVTPLDILSNGFKYRQYSALGNKSGVNYMYLAFAENPFALNARAR